MKNIILIAAILFAANTVCCAQNQITDTHPGATIYIYDQQSGQEVLAETDDAILFKDAVVELVSNTPEARAISHSSPGHKSIIVTQASPDQGNAYQIEMDARMFNQTSTLYTFSYNVDQNTLYYFDPNSQSWVTENVQGYNVNNLNNSLALGKFNDPKTWNTPTDDGTGDAPVQANTPPPALQEYQQPPCPVDGYLWQPGYWAFSRYNGGYYWVAGTWVSPPTPGYLWTPPYWGYAGGIYAFHSGYWGVSIGFYGGINYGYGYGGRGYYGGAWEGGHFRYNTAVVNVNTTVVHNTYVDRTVIVNNTVVNNNTTVNNKNVSFNGPGGAQAKPTAEEAKVATQPHIKDSSQDPKAPRTTVNNKPAAIGQQRAMPNANVAKTPNANTQKSPVVNNGPRTPGSAPGVPKVPGNGPGAARTNVQGSQRQQQGQYGSQRGNRQPARTEKAPQPSDDKKNHDQ